MAGYKIVEDTSKDFIANHAGADNFNSGIMTWSEGQDADNGIKATVANDPVVRYIDDRVSSRLLSNDLNLLFNLDRTVYVSKKGTADGMTRDEDGSSSIAKIQHFNTVSNALIFLMGLNNDTAPAYNGTNFWSSNTNSAGFCIMVGPGTYSEAPLATSTTFFQKLIAVSEKFPIHILGYGNNTVLSGLGSWSCDSNETTDRFRILFENLELSGLQVTNHLNVSTNFKNIHINLGFRTDMFLSDYTKYLGDVRFNNALVKFSGRNSMTVQTDTGFGFWSNGLEKSYFGETTMTDSETFNP